MARIDIYDSPSLKGFKAEIRIGGKNDFRVYVSYADAEATSGRFDNQVDAILAARLVERFFQALVNSELFIDCSHDTDLAAHLRAIIDSM